LVGSKFPQLFFIFLSTKPRCCLQKIDTKYQQPAVLYIGP
jgi:hypothetical protein